MYSSTSLCARVLCARDHKYLWRDLELLRVFVCVIACASTCRPMNTCVCVCACMYVCIYVCIYV